MDDSTTDAHGPAPRKAGTKSRPRTPPGKPKARQPKLEPAKNIVSTTRPAPAARPTPPPHAKEPERKEPGRKVPERKVPEPLAQLEIPLDLPTPAPAPASGPDIPLWAHLLADPGFAPEHVARMAVRRLGPQSAEWVASMRERYPEATDEALARLATAELTRAARRAGAAGAVGALLAVAVVQARLVLTIAAVYGEDPTAEERVRDLLTLLRVPRLTEPTRPALTHVAAIAGGVAVRRAASRIIRLGGAVAGAVQGARSTHDVADRAMEHYRRKPSWSLSRA